MSIAITEHCFHGCLVRTRHRLRVCVCGGGGGVECRWWKDTLRRIVSGVQGKGESVSVPSSPCLALLAGENYLNPRGDSV